MRRVLQSHLPVGRMTAITPVRVRGKFWKGKKKHWQGVLMMSRMQAFGPEGSEGRSKDRRKDRNVCRCVGHSSRRAEDGVSESVRGWDA